jgi:hypothetical protein
MKIKELSDYRLRGEFENCCHESLIFLLLFCNA